MWCLWKAEGTVARVHIGQIIMSIPTKLQNKERVTDALHSQFSSDQLSSVTQSCPTLQPMNRSPPGFPVHHQFPETLRFMSIESVMPSSHLILCRPLLLLPPIPPSIRVFSNQSTLCMRWPKYWSFSSSIIPSKEIPGLISLQFKGLSRVFSNTTVQKQQFF